MRRRRRLKRQSNDCKINSWLIMTRFTPNIRASAAICEPYGTSAVTTASVVCLVVCSVCTASSTTPSTSFAACAFSRGDTYTCLARTNHHTAETMKHAPTTTTVPV